MQISGVVRRLLLAPVLFLAAGGCGSSHASPEPQCAGEYVAQADDFGCIRDWPGKDAVRLVNRCGHQEAALEMLRNPHPNMELPVGTIIQVLPNEAMVKRGNAFDPEHGNWEYFILAPLPGGTRVVARGTQVFNVGGTCRHCHVHAREHDNVCGLGHDCPPPGVRNAHFLWTQYLDPRCVGP